MFADPRLAVLCDVVDELNASRVLDVGCGTGTLACMLARRGIEAIGIDPAAASLDVARRKPGAEQVRWVHVDAANVAPLGVDLAVMTGNVAQVFVGDADWADALVALRSTVRDDGWLVFETRDQRQRAWERWTKEYTYRELDVADVGVVATWSELVDVQEPLVSFRHVFRFARDGSELVSGSSTGP